MLADSDKLTKTHEAKKSRMLVGCSGALRPIAYCADRPASVTLVTGHYCVSS